MMKCPVCGGVELIHEARDVPFTYKGRKFIVEGVIGQHCPACGETVMTEAESDVYAAKQCFCENGQYRIDCPAYIVQIRKKLGLNQREASEILVVGLMHFRVTKKVRLCHIHQR